MNCSFHKGKIECPKSQLIHIRWDLNHTVMLEPLFHAFAVVLGPCSAIEKDEPHSLDAVKMLAQYLLQLLT